jgi:uncharacterized membrane protein
MANLRLSVGGVVGCFLGYQARTGLVKTLTTRDIYIALFEDLVAIVGRCGWCPDFRFGLNLHDKE